MIRGKYKKILWEIFDVLGFFEDEKERALDGFKRKFANQLLMEIRDCLSGEQREWIAQVVASRQYDKNNPKVAEIQKVIDLAYPREKMEEASEKVFKKILVSYIDFIVKKVDAENGKKIKEIADNF